MTKVRCDPEFCCGQEHEWPEITPCPKCHRLDDVTVWEAWGHPNGDLYCQECVGFNADAPINDESNPYWTWRMVDGQPVISVWERSVG